MIDEKEVGTPAEESASMSLVSNTLAIIGFVILIIVVVWGIFNIVKLTNFSFGNFFNSSPSIQVTAPQGQSGQSLTVSWKNTLTTPGTYAFLYQCENGFSFATPSQSGTLINVPCGTSLAVGSSTSATMVPLSKNTATTLVSFSVVFTPENSSAKTTGNTTLSIAPVTTASTKPATSTIVTPPAKKPTTSYRASGSGALVAHAASGPADLAVTIIASGYIDPASGALLTNRPAQPGDVVGVEFDIANIGGSATGSYSFQAHLPTQSSYTYNSPVQASLAPGAHVVSTLRFTQLAPGGIFTVVVDPNNQVNDANRANNEAAVTIQ